MDTGVKGGQIDGEPPRPLVAGQEGEPRADLALRLAELRDRVGAMEKEIEEFRSRIDELELALSGAPAAPGAADIPPAALEIDAATSNGQEDEGNRYLEQIQEQIHGLISEELGAIDKGEKSSPASPPGAHMVCPSCGAIASRTGEACPQCGAATEPAPEGDGRIFPLSAEKFLYVFNDRFGWFVKTCDKAMHYADRKNDYEKAIDLLKVVIQFMEENLALLKSKHRDFKLVLVYAYLGRCCFQSHRVSEAIEHYKKGILLKAGNSYNCEIGLTAVYRELVRQIGETGKPLTPKSHPFLNRGEIDTLNRLGTRAGA